MTYQIIDAIIENNAPELTAAEAHGVATGILCLDGRAESINWLTEIFSDPSGLLAEDKAILVSLFEQTRDLLTDDEFAFDLFLPDDERPLQEQVEGVCNWCHGFLLGVGHANSSEDWQGESREILKDIVEITKLEVEDDEQEDENALMEIHEYLRTAIMLIRAELYDSSNRRQIH